MIETIFQMYKSFVLKDNHLRGFLMTTQFIWDSVS